MALYDALADLPLVVESHSRATHERATSSGFDRTTTTFGLHGAGHTGQGEDVTYDTEDHERLRGHTVDLTGEYTFAEFSAALDDVALFPEPPEREASRDYRRWAVESAALDLALKQAGTTLADRLGRTYEPVRFVVSTRLADPPTGDVVLDWLDRNPDLEFKLDPTPAWDGDLVESLAATDADECPSALKASQSSPARAIASPSARNARPFARAWPTRSGAIATTCPSSSS